MPLESLINNTPLAIAASDATGRLTMFSPALQRLMNQPFRRVAEDEMVAHFDLHASDGVTPLGTEDIPLARALRGEVVIDAVVAARSAGKRMVYLRCNASPLRGEDEEIVGAVVLVQDVTAEMMAQRDQAKLRERLVDTVNHELRTPLAKIIGHAEFLEDDLTDLPERVHHSIGVIARAAADLLDLAGVVSDLSDLESGTQLTKTHGNVAGVVRDAVARIAHHAQARQLDVVASLPSQAKATIDPVAVGRAVAALLTNAVTYAPTGSTIEVAVAATRDYVDIHVSDAGSGIPASEISRLLRPFERGDHVLQPVNSKGLGLAVARTVATAHGGELLLERRDPAGLRATLSLPRSDVGRRTLDPDEPEPNLGGALPRRGQPGSTPRRQGSAEQSAAALMDALNIRIEVEQAKGVLAQVHSISVDEAFVLMLLYATARQQALGDVAQAVIEDPASLPDLTTPPIA